MIISRDSIEFFYGNKFSEDIMVVKFQSIYYNLVDPSTKIVSIVPSQSIESLSLSLPMHNGNLPFDSLSFSLSVNSFLSLLLLFQPVIWKAEWGDPSLPGWSFARSEASKSPKIERPTLLYQSPANISVPAVDRRQTWSVRSDRHADNPFLCEQ